MNDDLKEKLEIEAAQGEHYQRTWDGMIAPFFDQKSKELYDAFCQTPTDNKELMFDIKLQHNALNSLRRHFEEYIETGKLASKQLEKGE